MVVTMVVVVGLQQILSQENGVEDRDDGRQMGDPPVIDIGGDLQFLCRNRRERDELITWRLERRVRVSSPRTIKLLAAAAPRT